MKYAGQIKDLKTNLEKMTSQTKTRALKCTVDYNKQAEEKRQQSFESDMQKYFEAVLLAEPQSASNTNRSFR